MNGTRWLAMLLVGFGCAGCATTKYNPYKVSKEEVRNRVKVIALAPLNAPDDLSNLDQQRKDFEKDVTDELVLAGFRVVPSAEYEKIRTRLLEQMGGVFDPLTGKANEEKLKKIQELCRSELAAKHQADAVLFPSVMVVKAPFSQHQAGWDGVTENCTGTNFMTLLFGGGYQGSLPALSLWVGLYDISGNTLYVNGGGLQLLGKLRGGQIVQVPVQDLLIDPKIKERAAKLAISPLGPETAPPPQRPRP